MRKLNFFIFYPVKILQIIYMYVNKIKCISNKLRLKIDTDFLGCCEKSEIILI